MEFVAFVASIKLLAVFVPLSPSVLPWAPPFSQTLLYVLVCILEKLMVLLLLQPIFVGLLLDVLLF
jgi:hypothetical protein